MIQNNLDVINKGKEVIRKLEVLYKIKEDYPWVIGYSGGKDSSLVTQLVVEMLMKLKNEGVDLTRKIYLYSSDTMVENPVIENHVHKNIKFIQSLSDHNGLNIHTQIVYPAVSKTYWSMMIGKGYPAPNQTFRWCTDRLKISPVAEATRKISEEYEKVVILLGLRQGESDSRDRILKKHGNISLVDHPTISYAKQYTPILHFNLEEVWKYLLLNDAPWDTENEALNKELFYLYEMSSKDEECPWALDIDLKGKNCGNSRWGCWTCTVVTKDKSLTTFIEKGEIWLEDFLKLRNDIQENRNIRVNRYKGGIAHRKNISFKKHTMKIEKVNINNVDFLRLKKQGGRKEILISLSDLVDGTSDYALITKEQFDNLSLSEFYKEEDEGEIIIKFDEDHYRIIGVGPYTLTYRRKLLQQVMDLQERIGDKYKVISEEEIKYIKEFWTKLEKEMKKIE
jgi:DNA sulfur modification protein DndC